VKNTLDDSKHGGTSDREEAFLLPGMGLHEAVALLGAAAAIEDMRCSDRGRARKWQDGALRRAGLAFERRFREASAVLESPATGSALLPS